MGGRIRIAVLPRNGSNVDDPTVVSLAHQRHHCPAAIERPLNIDREDSLPVVDRILPQLCVRPTNSSVVDEYVDRRDDPERLLHGIVTEVRLLTSAAMLDPPSFFSAACAASPLRSQMTTFAPDATRRSAMANPNPDAPPVTTALRPFRSN